MTRANIEKTDPERGPFQCFTMKKDVTHIEVHARYKMRSQPNETERRNQSRPRPWDSSVSLSLSCSIQRHFSWATNEASGRKVNSLASDTDMFQIERKKNAHGRIKRETEWFGRGPFLISSCRLRVHCVIAFRRAFGHAIPHKSQRETLYAHLLALAISDRSIKNAQKNKTR